MSSSKCGSTDKVKPFIKIGYQKKDRMFSLIDPCLPSLPHTPISKNVVGENVKWQLSKGDSTTEKNCGFHIWYAKTMSSSRGAKLIPPYEWPTGPGLTWPFTKNLEIQRSTALWETPKKNEASATEFWRIWANYMTRHRRSALYGAGIMEDYLLLIFNTHISFQSCNPRSTIDISRSPRQHFLNFFFKNWENWGY